MVDSIFSVLVKHEKNMKTFDVYMGKSGIYLFLLFYCRIRNKNVDDIENVLDSIIDIADVYEIVDYGRLTCYAELAYLICSIQKEGVVQVDLDEYLKSIDESLCEGMLGLLEEGEYGCVNGAISIGNYFYYRYLLGKKDFKDLLSEFIVLLKKKSIEHETTIEWINIVEYGSNRKGHNLGIAHGMPGLLLFLNKLYNIGIEKNILETMIIKLVEFLRNQKHSLRTHKSYFFNINTEEPQVGHDSRLAWCYGDLSVGYSLYQTSLLGLVEDLKEYSLEILIDTTKRIYLSDVGVVDGGLCHGTSGLAHIYNRLYQQTKLDVFKTSSLYWYDQTLKMSKYQNEYAGYGIPYYLSDSEKELNEQHNLSFLTGISGIGLSLLAATSSVEPWWDKYLLLS